MIRHPSHLGGIMRCDISFNTPAPPVSRKLVRAALSLLAAGVLSTPALGQQNAINANNGPLVQTQEGPVRGYVSTTGVNVFLGIPYAAPPVGPLRWMPPQPVTPWTSPLDATALGNICAQVTTLAVFAGPASI